MRKKKFIFLLFFFSCFLTQIAPTIFFSKNLNYKCFKIYSHRTLDKNIYSILDKSEMLLKNSDLYNSKIKTTIFLCDNKTEFAFFNPFNFRSFATNKLFCDYIFINKCEIDKDLVKRNSNYFNKRSLSGVITHELTHTLLKNKIGLMRYFLLPTWKNEGYSDFIAKESTIGFDYGLKMLRGKKIQESNALNYFRYHLYVKYLMQVKNHTISDILGNDYNLKELDKQIINSSKSFLYN